MIKSAIGAAVTEEDDQGHIIYNRSWLALARHYRFLPRACRPYRAKTKGKVERLFADETTAPVLDPGRGRTKTGQL